MGRGQGRRRRPGGLTLVEMLVAAFLGGLILYVIITLLIPSLKMSALGTTRVDLDGRANLLESRLIRALRATCRSGIGYQQLNGTTALSTHPIRGALADSLQSWSDHLEVFVWREGQLVEWKVPWAELNGKAAAPPIETLLSALDNAQRQFTVDDLEAFQVELGQGPRVDFRFTLKRDKDELEVARSVFLVNSSQ